MPDRYFGSDVPKEGVTGAVPVISSDHEGGHQGKAFSASYYAAGVANGSSIVMTILAPAAGKVIHLKQWKPWGEGGLNKLEVFGGATVNVLGTLFAGATAPANRNQFAHKATVCAAVVRHSSTFTADGQILDGPVLFGGGGAGGGSGGSEEMDTELELEAGVTTQIKLTNLSGAAKALGLWLYWYEE